MSGCNGDDTRSNLKKRNQRSDQLRDCGIAEWKTAAITDIGDGHLRIMGGGGSTSTTTIVTSAAMAMAIRAGDRLAPWHIGYGMKTVGEGVGNGWAMMVWY